MNNCKRYAHHQNIGKHTPILANKQLNPVTPKYNKIKQFISNFITKISKDHVVTTNSAISIRLRPLTIYSLAHFFKTVFVAYFSFPSFSKIRFFSHSLATKFN